MSDLWMVRHPAQTGHLELYYAARDTAVARVLEHGGELYRREEGGEFVRTLLTPEELGLVAPEVTSPKGVTPVPQTREERAKEVSDRLRAPFAAGDIRQREGMAQRSFDYVTIGEVRARIIDATDNQFSWEVVSDEIVGDVHKVRGRLTISVLDEKGREGTGTAVLAPQTRPGHEDSFKSAESDAFKRAAINFGVGLHLYRDDEKVHGGDLDRPTGAPRPPQPRPGPPPRPGSAPEPPGATERPVAGGKATPAQQQAISRLMTRQGLTARSVDWELVTQAQAADAIKALDAGRSPRLPNYLDRNAEYAERRFREGLGTTSEAAAWEEVVVGTHRDDLWPRLVALAAFHANDVAGSEAKESRFLVLAKHAPTAKIVEHIVEVAQPLGLLRDDGDLPTPLAEALADRIDDLDDIARAVEGAPS
jgi:hypothetical protein